MVITVTRRHLVWALIVLALIVPRVAFSTGTLTIPNTIAAQSGPTLAASLLDTNWTTIASYVNAREVTINTLAARPAAGTAGRWYFASDDNQGTLYIDTGAAWTQVASAVGSGRGTYAVRGLQGATATATNSQFNVTADLVTVRNPTSGATVSLTATTTLTNNIFTAGPAANGRDRAAAFSGTQWMHLYYIYDNSALATYASLCAPTDIVPGCSVLGGPTLPTGFSYWAYIGAVRLNASATITSQKIRGSYAAYDSAVGVLTSGTATTETAVSVVATLPPNALRGLYNGNVTSGSTAGGSAAAQLCIRIQPGLDYGCPVARTLDFASAPTQAVSAQFSVPNVSQTFYYYLFETNPGNLNAVGANISVAGYWMPNGGE